MTGTVSRVERALREERLRQTRAVFFSNSHAFDDNLLARAAISALRDASPEVLGPIANVIVRAQNEERSALQRGDGSRSASVDRNALLIVDTWNAIIDAALASLECASDTSVNGSSAETSSPALQRSDLEVRAPPAETRGA